MHRVLSSTVSSGQRRSGNAPLRECAAETDSIHAGEELQIDALVGKAVCKGKQFGMLTIGILKLREQEHDERDHIAGLLILIYLKILNAVKSCLILVHLFSSSIQSFLPAMAGPCRNQRFLTTHSVHGSVCSVKRYISSLSVAVRTPAVTFRCDATATGTGQPPQMFLVLYLSPTAEP